MQTPGIDVSHWEGSINWALVKPQISFAILKCTEGTTYKDSRYRENKTGCVNNGIPHGVYHFFRSNIDGAAQAQYFYDFAADRDLKVWAVDVEANNGGDIRGNLKSMLDRLEQLTGVIPFIYTAKYFWNYNIGAQPWASRCQLWVANYEVSTPALPAGWTSWVFWQYSEKGNVNGIIGWCDMDKFDGTQDELNVLFGNGTVPALPQNEIMPQGYRVVTADWLNIRSLPSVSSNDIGTLQRNDDIAFTDEKDGWLKIEGWINKAYTRPK